MKTTIKIIPLLLLATVMLKASSFPPSMNAKTEKIELTEDEQQVCESLITEYQIADKSVSPDVVKLLRNKWIPTFGQAVYYVALRNNDALLLALGFAKNYASLQTRGIYLSRVLLDQAVRYSNRCASFKIIQMLLKMQCSVNTPNAFGQIPLHALIQLPLDKRNDQHYETLNMLLEAGSDVNRKDIYGNTPLKLAGKYDQRALVMLLATNEIDSEEAPAASADL